MPRSLSLLTKKRRGRRSGSPLWGALAQVLFFALLFFGGLAFLAVVVTSLVIPDWRANTSYTRAECTVLMTRLAERPGDETVLYRPEVQITYEVQGRRYETWTYNVSGSFSSNREAEKAKLDEFVVGRKYPCWYDPLAPNYAVLKRGHAWFAWVLMLLPLSMIATGGSGLGYMWFTWGTSTERRAVLAQRAAHIEIFENETDPADKFPTVPSGADLTDSAGVRLAYRLPIRQSQAWMVAATFAVTLVVNSLVAVFAILAARSHNAGQPDWFLTLFVIPWIAIGIATFIYFVRQVLIATGMGQTVIEISGHPLVPGTTYEAWLAQTGRLKVHRLDWQLVCEEVATYRQGTNTRTTTKQVYQIDLLSREEFEIRRGLPVEELRGFVLPHEVMHTFQSRHNAIRWKFVVQGKLQGWPDYLREFPVIVLPPPRGETP